MEKIDLTSYGIVSMPSFSHSYEKENDKYTKEYIFEILRNSIKELCKSNLYIEVSEKETEYNVFVRYFDCHSYFKLPKDKITVHSITGLGQIMCDATVIKTPNEIIKMIEGMFEECYENNREELLYSLKETKTLIDYIDLINKKFNQEKDRKNV